MTPFTLHDDHEWEQIGPCVYCADCHVRLYQGDLPAARRPACAEHDWDTDIGFGFYAQCRLCGALDWYE